MSQVIELIPNRIDRDPSILMGVTAPEFYTVGWMTLPALIAGSVIFSLLFESLLGGLFVGLILAAYTAFWGILWIARVKRGRPPLWLQHTTAIVMDKMGLSVAPFIHKTTRFHGLRQ